MRRAAVTAVTAVGEERRGVGCRESGGSKGGTQSRCMSCAPPPGYIGNGELHAETHVTYAHLHTLRNYVRSPGRMMPHVLQPW